MAMPNRTDNSPKYRYGFNGQEKDDEGEFGDLTHYDFGARIYNPGIGRFLSVDPLKEKYPNMTPYQFAGNMPTIAIDREGKDFIIITWHPMIRDQGHTAIAIANWKTVEIEGIKMNVHDGSYTIYEVAPDRNTGSIEDYVNNPNRIVKGIVSRRVVSSEEEVLNYTFGPKVRKPSGVVKIRSNTIEDKAAIEALNSLETTESIGYEELGETGHYEQIEIHKNTVNYSLTQQETNDNCTFSCSSFAITLASLLYGIDEGKPENIKTKGGEIFVDRVGTKKTIPSIDVYAYTPNRIFNIVKEIGKVLKGGDNKANNQDFINQVTGNQLKDETPGN